MRFIRRFGRMWGGVIIGVGQFALLISEGLNVGMVC